MYEKYLRSLASRTLHAHENRLNSERVASHDAVRLQSIGQKVETCGL